MKKGKITIIIIFLLIISGIVFWLLNKKDNTFVFTLNGDKDVYILTNGQYSDPSVKALYNDVDYSNQIIVNSNINTSNPGHYIITYYFDKANQTLTRNIYVSNFDDYITFNYNLKEDKKSVDINITTDEEKIASYTFNDDINKIDNSNITINKNGEYSYIIYDKYNNSLTKTITINSLSEEKEEIIASCDAVVENNKTTITVTTNNQISKYIYNDIESSNNTYTFDKSITDNKVIVYDKYNQTKEIICNTKIIESDKLEIHFINADGYYDDAILIKTNKATIFIDGGRGKQKMINYLKTIGIKSIDYVIGSHTEYDHIDAQANIIREFDVKGAIYPNSISKCGCSCDSKDVGNVNRALKEKNITPIIPEIPSKMNIGDMEIYFLVPYQIGCNKNNNSFVFILKFVNNYFMFTGDQDSYLQDVDKLMANANKIGLSSLKADLLKYPHHGNQYLTDKFLKAVRPKYSIVPNVNSPNNLSKKSQNLLEQNGVKIYKQSDSSTGNILVSSDGNNITIKMDINPSDYANR